MCHIVDYDYEVVDVISIRDGNVLLVKKRDFWTLPGGKRKRCESARDCIARELSEELPNSRPINNFVSFCQFRGLSPSKKKIRVRCYFGNVEGDISPGAEISDARWVSVSKNEIFSYPLSEVTKQIIEKLLAEKFI